ncbi:UDP-N-acetylmuramate dehydrogenase [Flavobacterium sp. MXW15]|uniref:UDP-N-acetylenolpyruvoylglucosamine reductase n=1 Tax=Xanthomonas chitinilytica TaxID=2989819 RepID=A0ABT3JW90_9XANT|nr:UDP-N-acetylmuramate dehydrogenase [Xanthomonas sp. H13-6]MCW4455083.1 UDP-N-acetylmuramate dehydrogenase [Flavobacterium sp. MXW15]MCW4472751.1 UDP-N-acetylmuramate dehydrogenase [Xanthomonas sp. H13-6]
MSNPGWSLTENTPLQALNTFHVAATAPRLLEVFDPAALPQALETVAGRPLLVLGSGSNVLLAADPPDTVLVFGNDDITTLEHRADHAVVRAGAGVNWHQLVMWSLAQGLSGLENLALIPGTAGAAPIQNIGAYGVQVGEFIHAVDAWDTQAQAFVRFDADGCRFGYRDSVFKQEPDRYLIAAIELKLPLLHELRMDYAGIREELEAMGVELPGAADVANAVIAIRRRKLPDPDVLGNAGSFFKNPVLPLEQVDVLLQHYPRLPVFPAEQDDRRKVSAAWMIDACGWKGHREGDAGVADSHALVLVNHGHASGAELLQLARKISASVLEKFGVPLEPEPRLIGERW